MVHSKPEYAESVKLLTYSQLRRLEKLDLKKAREEKLIELGKQALASAGQAGEGLFAGLGLGLQGYLSGDAASFVLKSAAGIILLDWIRQEYPGFAHLTHLDTLAFGTRGPPPPSNGKFCIINQGVATRALVARGFGFHQQLCYDTMEERSAAEAAFRELYSGVQIEEVEKG